jgi:DUF2075 family protein
MTCAWSGTVRQLRKLVATDRMTTLLNTGYQVSFEKSSPSQVESWSQSLPAVLGALPSPDFDDVLALVELAMPVGAERADLVLLGGMPSEPRGAVIELKQWSFAIADAERQEVDIPGFGPRQHPSFQVLNYEGKLRLFHSRAADYVWNSAVYLHNMDPSALVGLSHAIPSSVSSRAPMFGKGQAGELEALLREALLPCQIPKAEASTFNDAPYEQTAHLFDVIARHAKDIAERATLVLAEAGIGLTEEQENIVEEVLASARREEHVVFSIRGGPGSGKTLVAVTLLLRAVNEGLRCVLAIRNNRLQAILRRCFDSSYPGASGMMMFFEPRGGTGIGHVHFPGQFDLVICDEAQRMEAKIMPTVLARAPVSAVLLDETQRLNPPEEGTTARFAKAALEADRAPCERTLAAAVRCRGGLPYHNWVEEFLGDPRAGRPVILGDEPWREKYLFATPDSVQELLDQMASLRDDRDGSRVALVASFTESPGSMAGVGHDDNVRVGYPLASGWEAYRGGDFELRWLMKPNEYVQFWMQGKSSELSRVASIYGTQGFESDYVGVVWGRDLVIRSGTWQLGDPKVCYDTIDGLVSRGKRRQWCGEALDLVRNRYRIFLTRGIKGSLVFFEDSETREWLRSAAGR